jgi:NAD(P)-dependent dehydrogenase (short-subunit alcohol dehydrogenase family)
MDLQGKVAVITGAASGIGLETARRLGDAGCRLVLADVEVTALEQAAGELGEVTEVLPTITDVADLSSVEALADATYERFGRADVVFNNAGVAVGGPVTEMTHDDWRWIIDVDLWGPVHGVEAFLPRMVAAGDGGHLLFTASFAGLVPNVGLGPYCVAKYGVVALAEVLYRELRADGIGVSVLCPMRVETNIGSSQRNRPQEFGGPEASPPVPDQAEANQDLAGRVLQVSVVAEHVVAAIGTDRLYIVPHGESRAMIRRRFERIDRAFDDVAAPR